MDGRRAADVLAYALHRGFEIGGAVSGLTVGILGELVGKRPAFIAGVVFPAIGLVVLRRWAAPASPRPEVEPDTVDLSMSAGN